MHVPFCARRCGYCNFTVVTGRDEWIDEYLRALEIEMSWLQSPREVETLFIGGGTPTYLPPEQLGRLLELVRRWLPVVPGAEVSIEANPLDVTPEKGAVMQAGGITRVSLGGQSFQEGKLRILERDHGPDDIVRAVEVSRRFATSVSLDLIFGAPGETLEGWLNDLERGVNLSPDHISTYGLTFEKGTRFWGRRSRGELVQAEEETEGRLYEEGIDFLARAGFEHYEVSNFARPGFRCRHNEAYWNGESYYAFGPGAARYVEGRREVNHRGTQMYLKKVLAGESPVMESETLSAEDRARERLVIGLRQLAGLNVNAFRERTGFSMDSLGEGYLPRFIEEGLLEISDGRLRLTRRGLLISDSIWPYFLRR